MADWRARLEGMDHVPIVRFGPLSEAQQRAYVIADNKISNRPAGTENPLDRTWRSDRAVADRGARHLDYRIQTGEIDWLLSDMAASRPDPDDAIPAFPQTAVTRRGDL
jgi:hypothetical protein